MENGDWEPEPVSPRERAQGLEKSLSPARVQNRDWRLGAGACKPKESLEEAERQRCEYRKS